MKRIISSCIAVLITVSTMFSVFAADNIDFKLNNAECNVNRLVEIEVIASSSQRLSAVTFEFTYDKSMFEFRDTKSINTGASVKSNELDNCVKVVYLCTDGTDISNGKAIFTVTFKAIKAGTGYIDFNVYECVDRNVEFMEVGSCTSAKITVNSSSQNNESAYNNSSKSSHSLKSSGNSQNNKASESKSTRIETTTSQATVDNLGTINPINDNKYNYIFLGASIGICIILILIFVFFIGRKTASAKNKNNKL